jgi:hypothetical protein
MPYEEVGPDTWVIQTGNGAEHLVATLATPVVVFRCKVMDVPSQHREEFYRALLELNVEDLVHGAYGIEGNAVILSGALELENLDFNEFQAVVEDISLAVANHYAKIAKFRTTA